MRNSHNFPPLREVDGLEVIILVDNVIDLGSSTPRREVKRVWWLRSGDGDGPMNLPLAEHGFSALVRLRVGDELHTLLFDAGASGTVALHNARCIRWDWNQVEAVALSHGHLDHTGGLPMILRHVGRQRLPIYAHDDMFIQRGALGEQGRVEPALPPLSLEELTALGGEVITHREPRALFDGALLVMGEVPRQTDFEGPHPTQMRREGGQWISDPWIWDDRSLVARVRGEGTVVITGCAHAGLINTLLYAGKLTSEPCLRAVIGGFHLFGARFEPRIERVVSELVALSPALLVPSHCTGPRGACALLQAMPAVTVIGGALLRVRLGHWDD